MPWPGGLLPEFKPDLGQDEQPRHPVQVRKRFLFVFSLEVRELIFYEVVEREIAVEGGFSSYHAYSRSVES